MTTNNKALATAIDNAYKEFTECVNEQYGIQLTATATRIQEEEDGVVTVYWGNFTQLADKEVCMEVTFYTDNGTEWYCEQMWALVGDFMEYCKETGIIE